MDPLKQDLYCSSLNDLADQFKTFLSTTRNKLIRALPPRLRQAVQQSVPEYLPPTSVRLQLTLDRDFGQFKEEYQLNDQAEYGKFKEGFEVLPVT